MGAVFGMRLARAAVCVGSVIALAACGGGGGGGGGAWLPLAAAPATPPPAADPATPPPAADPATPAPPDSIVPSSSVAAQCAAPRTGIDPSTGEPFIDTQGSASTEKSWLRAWIDETYLWYDEVPALLAQDYATPVAYFDVLRTPNLTASGRPKDRFHFTIDTAQSQRLAKDGTEIGYGMDLAFINAAPPREVRIAYVEPNSPAYLADVVRGDQLIAIDGIDVMNGADVTTLNAALAPGAEGENHSFKLRAVGGVERTVSLTSASVKRNPVPYAYYYDMGPHRIGYMLFNSHTAEAEYRLVGLMNAFRDQVKITDLVIDMRYNGGGYLDIASQLAFMVSSTPVTTGKVFEQLEFNNKNPFQFSPDQTKVPFLDKTIGLSAAPDQPLPELGLSSVTVLTGPDTCSASESVINGLRGIGVNVNVVGGSTCGKPYGFIPKDNCGTTYYAIQFHGVNQQGFGDYGDGIAPTCVVPDDFMHQIGDINEARLAVAFSLIQNGVCPDVRANGKTSTALSKAEANRVPYLARSPLLSNRWLRRP